MRIWFNAGYSQTRDAILLVQKGAVDAGMAIELIATHSRSDAPALAVSDIAAVEPQIDRSTPEGQAAYTVWCIEFATRNNVDIFIVQRGRSEIARRQSAFDAINCKTVLAAGFETMEAIENKARFYNTCRQAAIPTPISISVGNLLEFDVAVSHIEAENRQVCIKPPYGVFGSGYFRLDNKTSMFRQLMNIENRAIQTRVVREAIAETGIIPDLLVMQHLPGTEWSVDCLCDRGRIIAGFVRTKRKHTQLIDANPQLMALAARVAAVFDLSNLVNIQFKSASPGDDDPHVLEINPRMSGGCAYGSLAGINLPFLQVLFAASLLDETSIPPVTPTVTSSIAQAIDIGAIGGKLIDA